MSRSRLSPVTLWQVGLVPSLMLWGVGVQTSEALASLGWVTCLFFCLMSMRGREGVHHPARDDGRLVWWVLAFIGVALVLPMLSGHLPTGTGVARMLDWLGIPVAALAWTQITADGKRRVAVVVAATLVLSCLVAGLQSFGIWPNESEMSWLAQTKTPFARVYEQVPGSHRWMAGGLLFHRLKFAHVTALGVLFALGLALRSGGSRRFIGAAVALFGLLAVVFFPFARAAAVALVFACGVVLARSMKPKWALVGGSAIAVLLAAGVWLSPALQERFATASDGERGHLLQAGIRAWRTSPLVGVGAGRFRPGLFAIENMPDQAREHAGKAHNQFITLAAETGAFGLAAFLALLGYFAQRFWRAGSQGAVGLGVLAIFVLLSMVHDPLFHAPFSMALALALGIAIAEAQPKSGLRAPDAPR